MLCSFTHYIYIVRNINTGEFYVGRTKDPEGRLSQHRAGISSGMHPNVKILDSFCGDTSKIQFLVVGEVNGRNMAISVESWMIRGLSCVPGNLNIAGTGKNEPLRKRANTGNRIPEMSRSRFTATMPPGRARQK